MPAERKPADEAARIVPAPEEAMDGATGDGADEALAALYEPAPAYGDAAVGAPGGSGDGPEAGKADGSGGPASGTFAPAHAAPDGGATPGGGQRGGSDGDAAPAESPEGGAAAAGSSDNAATGAPVPPPAFLTREALAASDDDALVPQAAAHADSWELEPIAPPDDDEAALGAYRVLEQARRKKRIRRIVVALVVVAALLAAAGWWAANNLVAVEEPAAPEYALEPVYTGDFETSVSASGSTQPNSSVAVTPEVEGIIAEVRVAEGDTVEAGDVLVVLRNDDLDKDIAAAQQQVRSAENGVTSAARSVDSAWSAYSRAVSARNSLAGTEFPTQAEADAAVSEADAAISDALSAAEAAELAEEDAELALDAARDALAAAQATADKRTIKAPAAGTVVAVKAEVGAQATTAGGALVTIADLSQLRVTVQVNELDISTLEVGQEARVTFSALPDVELAAQVEHIAAVASGAGDDLEFSQGGIVTYAVDLVIPEPDARVKPGMTARADIMSQRLEGVTMVAQAALMMEDDTTALLYVTHDPDAEEPVFDEVEVTVVATDGTTAVIEGAAGEGDFAQVFYDLADFGGDFDDTMAVG